MLCSVQVGLDASCREKLLRLRAGLLRDAQVTLVDASNGARPRRQLPLWSAGQGSGCHLGTLSGTQSRSSSNSLILPTFVSGPAGAPRGCQLLILLQRLCSRGRWSVKRAGGSLFAGSRASSGHAHPHSCCIYTAAAAGSENPEYMPGQCLGQHGLGLLYTCPEASSAQGLPTLGPEEGRSRQHQLPVLVQTHEWRSG